jgi:thymidine kinase
MVAGEECPAPYFDPLIIIGGDKQKEGSHEPNYCTRCDQHHYLPGKEYAFLVLKPLGEHASRGMVEPLAKELDLIAHDAERSELHRDFVERYGDRDDRNLKALNVECLAERALLYLFTELNLVSAGQLRELADTLHLNREYLARRLADNHRSDVLST